MKESFRTHAAGSRAKTWRHAFAGLAAMLLLTVSSPSEAASFVEREYADAVRTYRAGRYSDAFGKFIETLMFGEKNVCKDRFRSCQILQIS